MNDHDRDLILALTAGTLSETEAEAALARVSADPELTAEYQLQTRVRAQLEAVPTATMTASERTSLREGLATQLHLDTAPAVAPAPVKRRVPWWQPVMGLAAAAVFVTAIVILPGQLGGGDDAADEVALTAEEEVQTTLATDTAATGGEVAEGSGDSAEDGAALDTPPTTDLPEFDDTDGEELLTLARGKSTPDEVEESVNAQGLAPRSFVDSAGLEACLESLAAQLPEGDLIPMGTDVREGEQLVFLGVDSGAGVDTVVTVNVTTCSISDVDR